MDYKPKKRKIYKTQEANEYDKSKQRKETMQECLDRMGYESLPENPSAADEYVKYLGW